MNDQQPPKEVHVRAACPTCGQERVLDDLVIRGWKGRYATHVYSCHQCRVTTTYGSELTLVGDFILTKSSKPLEGHENA
jgi:predicted RNA-binding Zn-ribbon protein involved in translation (DUF1610 family)